MKKISIIMPAYNSGEFIERSIMSVLKQTYQNIELLIVNDGSIDDTKEKVVNLMKNNKRIKYFEIENSGSAVARNCGLENATGDYIAFVDSDDYIDEEMLRRLMKEAIKYNCDIVSCSYERIYKKEIIPEETFLSEGFYDKEKMKKEIFPYLFSHKTLKDIIPTTMVTKLYRRELIEANKIKFVPELKMSQDKIFATKCFLNSERFYYLPDNKDYKYFFNKDSRTNTYLVDAWDILKKNQEQLIVMSEEYPEAYYLKEQLPYAMIRNAMTALANISRNEKASLNKFYSEINKVVNDVELQEALNLAEFNQFSLVRKVVSFLLKKRLTLLLYIAILLNA